MRVELGRIGIVVVLLFGNGCEQEQPLQGYPAGQLRLGSVLGDSDLTGYAVADQIRRFDFPADHGSHPAFRSEWWYLTLVLDDTGGRALGVQFTLFRQSLSPDRDAVINSWQTPDVYLGHFAVSDVAGGTHQGAERFARGHPRLAGVSVEPFRLWLEDWRLESAGDHWRLVAETPTHGVDLNLEMNQPVVLQGEDGLSRKGPGQASYYYSIPGIPVKGSVRIGDSTRAVSGRGWLDREWSTSVLGKDQVGWDWFALQLDDQRKIMVYQLRRRDGSRDAYDQGVLVGADGETRRLGPVDFSLRPERYWTDEQGTRWPVKWELRILGQSWQVVASLEDQKMDTTVSYWEGMVDVYDAAGALIGRGYLEMTGYADQARQEAAENPASGEDTNS